MDWKSESIVGETMTTKYIACKIQMEISHPLKGSEEWGTERRKLVSQDGDTTRLYISQLNGSSPCKVLKKDTSYVYLVDGESTRYRMKIEDYSRLFE
jgi:hypothetical protein